ncbi:ferric aerobactin receptor [Leptolyngbya sp. Heron Island J]|uniref:TonB-dependent receptor n=1 Tax=Leptolyngbya sp. Heron Island J TaxID=1385935 RepID=UPI0003B98A01|nr:TonB-dependent receptor [Leptolyngbya sp. Heron Island J]ESA33901.1 ferric aerobactin receptor [Leptolyngbya sp. Heron Island J]
MKIQSKWVGYAMLASLVSAMSAQSVFALDIPQIEAEQLSQASPEPENEETDDDNEEAAEDSAPLRIVVTATRTERDILEVPRSITVIDREDIEQQLLFNNSLADILGRLVPGYATPPGTTETQPRGGLRGRPIVVLIDGVPQTPNNDGFGSSLRIIDPELIERVEVLRGPSAIYGDGGTGGVVNIITRRPTEDSISYEFSTGVNTSLTSNQNDRFGYSGTFGVSAADEQGDGVLAISYDTVNGQFDADGDRIIRNGINDTDRLGLLAKVGFNLTDEQRLGLTYNFFKDETFSDFTIDNSVLANPDAEFGRALRIDVDYEEPPEQVNHVLNLTYRHENILGSQLDAQVYYRDTELVQIFTDLRGLGLPPFFPALWQTTLDDTEIGGRLQIDTPLGNSANLLWGADYSQNDTASPLFIGDVATFSATGRIDIIDTSLDRFAAYDLNSLGLFAQSSWDITDQFQISGGLRYENVDLSVEDYNLAFRFPRERQGGDSSFDDVLFNAGLLYRPIPEIGVFASFAQGFSIPNIGDSLQGVPPVFNVTDDLLLDPQKVDNYEIGLQFEFNQLQGTLAGFYNESDLGSTLTLDPVTGFPVVNRAPQRNYGVEATLDWQPSDTWRLGGLFSWNEGESDIDDDGDFEELSLLEIEPIKVGLYVENQTTPGWTNRFDVFLVGTRDPNDSDVAGGLVNSVGDYTTVDFTSSINLGQGKLSLGIGNLFNEQYASVRQQTFGQAVSRIAAAPGRTFQIRYSVSF